MSFERNDNPYLSYSGIDDLDLASFPHTSHSEWNDNLNTFTPFQPQQQQRHQHQHQQPPQQSRSSYASPPPPHPFTNTRRDPPLPTFGNFEYSQSYLSHPYNYQRPSQISPTDSLNAALREGTDCLPRGLSYARSPLPPLQNSPPAVQQNSFGYIPEYFFHSPPQSPQESVHSQPYHPTESSTAQPSAGPSTNQYTNQHPTAFSADNYTAASFAADSKLSDLRTSPDQTRVGVAGPSTMPSATTSTSASASRKRPRLSLSGSSPPSSTKRRRKPAAELILDDDDDDEIEELGPDSDLLAKQREELVSKQREESNKTLRMGDLNCMICLEHFTNMTATHCGHIFCHECLTQALTASQRNSDHNFGTCPACRKPVKPRHKNQIIPLTLMKAKRKKI